MQTILLPALAKPRNREAFLVTDCPGLASAARESSDCREANSCGNAWSGGRLNYNQAIAACLNGDMEGVAASDDLLAKLESVLPEARTNAWQTLDSLSGGVPNVPAYLSGNPMNMRKRTRMLSQQNPIAILADTTLSAAIDAPKMRARGAAILALARLLSGRRPIELYGVVGAGNGDTGAYVMVRIETAPLDMARAAFILTEPAATRGIGYSIIGQMHRDGTLGRNGWGGGWAHGSDKLYRENAQASMARVLGSASDSLYIPAAHVSDAAISKPIEWLTTMLRQYGGETLAEA